MNPYGKSGLEVGLGDDDDIPGADANVLPARTKLKKEEARILEERIKAGEGKTPAEVIRKDIERGNREFRRKKVRKSKRG